MKRPALLLASAALLLGTTPAAAPVGRDAGLGHELRRLHLLNHRLRQAVGLGVPAPLVPWLRVGACESGLRADAVSSGSRYFGAWQFAPSSWRAVGGRGLPSEASFIEQLYRAELLQRVQGWGAWPVCARGLG